MAVIEVGDRVLVDGKLGVVRYAGLTEFCSGFWYGIELERCEGFNDGSVDGKRYFDVLGKRGNYGLFAQVEDLHKIDDYGGLKDENRKLTGVVEALERKIRQLHLQRNDSKVVELQRTVKGLIQERDQRIKEHEETVEENKQLCATVNLLQAKLNGLDCLDLKSENDRLVNELSKLKEDNRQYAALQAVYIDIEKELQDQLATLENYILTEGEKTCGSATAATKAALYDEFYTAVFPNERHSTQLLELQYDILQRCVANPPLELSIQDKLTGQLYFLILRELANEQESRSSNRYFDVLRNEFGDNGIICSELLSGHLQDHMLRIRELIDLLNNSDSLDSDFRLVISSMSQIFGNILPQLLSSHRKENLSDSVLRSISDIYSVSLSIEKELKVLAEKVEVDSVPTIPCHIRLSQVLEVVFSMITYDPGFDARPFADFKPAFEEILASLKHIEAIPASSPQNLTGLPQTTSFTDSQTARDSSDLTKVAFLQSELSKKEARIEEFAVKIQLLEIKLQESHTKQTAQLQREAEKTKSPRILDEDDLHSDAQLSTGPKVDSADDFDEHSSSTDFQLETFAKQSINSEILSLQRVVASLTKYQRKSQPNFSWLYEDKRHPQALTTKTHIDFRNKLHDLTASAIEVAEYTRMVPYQEDLTERQKNYLPNAVFKQNVLNLKIKDISA
ncbi:hypothetical protein HG537_0F01670 [Torulaspora globosa]|uniref:CAP-Gly domain-containing protein n=1 Tax=Torulaspora globosa TaxID=48254 RepID=A0A7H9HWZ3_9SACH|nr:hypothetical protein HG537_0F01670 [Torulaspora sp. CBS 2947]